MVKRVPAEIRSFIAQMVIIIIYLFFQICYIEQIRRHHNTIVELIIDALAYNVFVVILWFFSYKRVVFFRETISAVNYV